MIEEKDDPVMAEFPMFEVRFWNFDLAARQSCWYRIDNLGFLATGSWFWLLSLFWSWFLVVILLFQVVGVLAGLVVGILLLGFAIQFCRERGSASEKVKTGFCENNLQYFFNIKFHRIHRRWRRMWLKTWTEQKLLLFSWTSASRPQGKNPGLF